MCVKHADPTTTGIMSNLKYEELFGPEIRLVFDNTTLKSSDKQKAHKWRSIGYRVFSDYGMDIGEKQVIKLNERSCCIGRNTI